MNYPLLTHSSSALAVAEAVVVEPNFTAAASAAATSLFAETIESYRHTFVDKTN
ncbi:MAG: hypothetical protein ACE5IR_15545 [bacterium]